MNDLIIWLTKGQDGVGNNNSFGLTLPQSV